MKYLRLITIALVTLFAAVACKDDGDAGGHAGAGASNDLLAYVPSDTPYVVANLELVPEDVIDIYLERLQPVLDVMQTQLTAAKQAVETNPGSLDDPASRLLYALVTELDGNVSRPGLENLGLDLRSKRVVYGMGAFPVIRFGLSDAQRLRDTIARVLESAEITAPEQQFKGVSYWRLSDEHGEVPAGLYVSVLEDHLAVSLFPAASEPEMLPAFLGLELPSANDAQARLQKLNSTHGYTGYGSGILDVRKFADQFLNPDSVTGRALAGTGELDPANFTPECVAEIGEMVENAPRMTMGIKQLDATTITTQYRVETPATLAGQLVGLVSKIPAADPMSSRMFELAFGMRFGPVRDFLRQKATAIMEDPYQCTHLLELNDSAAQALAQIDQPMPPFLNNFRGLRVSLSEVTMNQGSIPESASGYLAVHVEQPQMFVGMAQMFLPDLSTLQIAPGEDPVRIPANLIPVPGLVTFAAMSDDAIGLSLGEGEESGLPAFLEQKAGPEGTFLSASYDMAAYQEYSRKMEELSMAGHEEGNDFYPRDLANAIDQAVRQMADRSSTSMAFNTGGLVIDTRMTFK